MIAFDPGTKIAGVALFDGVRVIDVLQIKQTGSYAAARAVDMAIEIADAILTKWSFLLKYPGGVKFVCEYPQFYGRQTPGDGDSILALCLVLGALAMELVRRGFPKPKLVRPREWKRQTKKEVMTARIELCCAPCEIKVMENVRAPRTKKIDHNVLDAVGIGFAEVNRIPLAGTPINMWLRTDAQVKDQK